MNFNSLHFLIFLPVVLLVYWLLPHKVRWAWLLLASYYFYMSWNAVLVFLIFGTTAVSYGAALVLERTQNKNLRRLCLVLTLIVCLGTLFFFKYFNFLLDSVFSVLRLFSMDLSSPALNILLPVGISFYTFQTLSYVIDVYRGDFRAERHFGYYALFVSYFPQLVAGPIERPDNLLPQLRQEHRLNAEDMAAGFRILLCGFFRKCVVADTIAVYVDSVFADLAGANGLAVFAAASLFTVQMYCDFAGYSEIATGAARMMGVRLMTNFDRPLTSESFGEFFRRWHISLNRWFTDYLYIPLGGNRKGTARKLINLFVVFLLCGLWHGASWTYVLWGAYAGFFVCLETVLRKPYLRFFEKRGIDRSAAIFRFLRRAVLLVLFAPAAILFRAPAISDAGLAFSRFFSGFGAGYVDAAFASLSAGPADVICVALCILCMSMVYYMAQPKSDFCGQSLLPVQERTLYAERVSAYLYCTLAIALAWLILLSNGDMSAFAYFRF